MKKKEYKRRLMFAQHKAAKAWCGKNTSHKIIDIDLMNEFAKILVFHMYEPHLGCAKTSELKAEIKARCGREKATIDCEQ